MQRRHSKTLREYVQEDENCSDKGNFITYIFGKVETVLGIARMKIMTFNNFREEINIKKFFSAEDIEEFKGLPVVYMSRAGVSKDVDGLGFGTMLRSFLDGHTRTILKKFLLYALINENMHKSMILRYGNEFFSLYKVSKRFYDDRWKWYWVILREFSLP